MSEESVSKIKKSFEEFILTKQVVLDVSLIKNSAARIQESHITAGQAMLQYIEDKLLDQGYLQKS
jgi:hypothetical protein